MAKVTEAKRKKDLHEIVKYYEKFDDMLSKSGFEFNENHTYDLDKFENAVKVALEDKEKYDRKFDEQNKQEFVNTYIKEYPLSKFAKEVVPYNVNRRARYRIRLHSQRLGLVITFWLLFLILAGATAFFVYISITKKPSSMYDTSLAGYYCGSVFCGVAAIVFFILACVKTSKYGLFYISKTPGSRKREITESYKEEYLRRHIDRNKEFAEMYSKKRDENYKLYWVPLLNKSFYKPIQELRAIWRKIEQTTSIPWEYRRCKPAREIWRIYETGRASTWEKALDKYDFDHR